MLLPVSYLVWDVGRGLLFAGFVAMLIAVGASRARRSAGAVFGTVAAACLAAAAVSLAVYAVVTGWFAQHIVQLPEYARDYAHHGYASPHLYLSEHYLPLLRLQIFSWAVSTVMLVPIAGSVALVAGRLPLGRGSGRTR